MLRLGLSSGALYPGVATEDVPERARELGFTELEILLQTAGEYRPEFARLLSSRMADFGCRVHAVHTYQPLHPLTSPYQKRTEEAIALFRLAIDAGNRLGARTVVWHGLTRKELSSPDTWETLARVSERLGGYCAEANVTLALENVSWCALASVRDVMTFAARIPELGPAGSIGFAFDPFQAAEAGANPFMMLAAMEREIADVHLSDHRAHEPSARHLPPGDGDLPWPALIRAIAAAGYDGPMMIEGPVVDEAGSARIRNLFDPLIAAIAAEGDPCDGPPPQGVLEGIELFNAGHYYEAHETLEHEWHAERRPIRRLYQGILQIGVGFHHARAGNHKGAVLLLTDGIAKVSEFQPSCQGIDTARLVRESQHCLDQIAALEPEALSKFDWNLVPTVHWLSGGS
jgi:sugar phosphate isomerase/epimerase/predicted metal-dependent hydrolase